MNLSDSNRRTAFKYDLKLLNKAIREENPTAACTAIDELFKGLTGIPSITPERIQEITIDELHNYVFHLPSSKNDSIVSQIALPVALIYKKLPQVSVEARVTTPNSASLIMILLRVIQEPSPLTLITKAVEEDLKDFGSYRQKVIQELLILESNPYSLEFSLPGGACRSIYKVKNDKQICLVVIVGYHENIYEKAQRRVEYLIKNGYLYALLASTNSIIKQSLLLMPIDAIHCPLFT